MMRTTPWMGDDYKDVIGRVESGTETEVERRRKPKPSVSANNHQGQDEKHPPTDRIYESNDFLSHQCQNVLQTEWVHICRRCNRIDRNNLFPCSRDS